MLKLWKLTCAGACGVLAVACSSAALAAKPRVLHEYVDSRAVTSAIVNMDSLDDMTGCQNFVGAIKVGGVQFSASGATVDLFWFVDRRGARWSVPTNIGKADFSNRERDDANNLIKVGGTYWAHIFSCGTGGFASLVSLYDMSLPFGAK